MKRNSNFKDRLFLWLPAFLLGMLLVNVGAFFWSQKERNADRQSFVVSLCAFTNQMVQVRAAFSNEVLSSFRRSTEAFGRSFGDNLPNVDRDRSVSLPSISSVTNSLMTRRLRFMYFEIDCVPFMRYFGQDYTEGQVFGLGRISRIFPDRVFLDSGIVIENTFNPDDVPVSVPKVEVVSYD